MTSSKELRTFGTECVFHHRALTRGYVSKKQENGIVEEYKGKFGTGYTVKKNNPDSTRYCFIEYYINK